MFGFKTFHLAPLKTSTLVQSIPVRHDDQGAEQFQSFKDLKALTFEAIEKADFNLLNTCIGDWQELCDSAASFLYEAVILLNPLARAVQTKRYKIISFLVRHAEMRLDPFHQAGCDCRLCGKLANDHRFLQLYIQTIAAAAADPSYVFCAQPQTAIDYVIDLRRSLRRYEARVGKATCEPVVDVIENTVILALQCAVNEREAMELLEESSDESSPLVEQRLTKILHFMDLDMKRAIHHPTVQSIIEHEWTGGNHSGWANTAALYGDTFLGALILGLFVYFILTPVTIFFPHPKFVQIIETPSARFQSNIISFIMFYIVAVQTSIISYLDVHLVCLKRHESTILHTISTWQGVLGLMILAKIFRIMSGIYFTGKRLIVGFYDILYLLSINLTVLGTTLILISVFIIPERQEVHKLCKWMRQFPSITELRNTKINCSITNYIYASSPSALDVFTTISEPYIIGSVFVGGSFLIYLISGGAFLYNFKVVALFAITLQELVYDVMKWVLFFMFFLFGWCFAFKTLYSNFICNTAFFNDIGSTLKELFWIGFAMSGTTDYQLNSPVSGRTLWSKSLIETSGALFYMGFFLIGTLILVNLLIALMSVSYERLEDNKRIEVCYWRSKLRIKFILWNDSLALPFNLLYPFYVVSRIIWACVVTGKWNRCFRSSVAQNRIGKENQKRIDEKLVLNERLDSVFQQISNHIDDETDRL